MLFWTNENVPLSCRSDFKIATSCEIDDCQILDFPSSRNHSTSGLEQRRAASTTNDQMRLRLKIQNSVEILSVDVLSL